MIEAALDAPEGAMTLRVKGHARFAAPVLRAEKGTAYIHARARPGAAAYLAGAAGAVEAGFKRLSEGFPDNVRFTGGHAEFPAGAEKMEELYEKQRSGL